MLVPRSPVATIKLNSLSLCFFGVDAGVGSGVGVGTGATTGGFACLLPDCAFAAKQQSAMSRARETPNTVSVGLNLICFCSGETDEVICLRTPIVALMMRN